jgi:hypothetical protein
MALGEEEREKTGRDVNESKREEDVPVTRKLNQTRKGPYLALQGA